MTDLTQGEVLSLLFYGALGLWLATAIPRLFRGRFIAGLMALGFWTVAFLAAVTGYAYRTELNMVVARVMATVVPGTPVATGPSEVTVFRAADGEFVVRGSAGPVKLQFVLDTGASAVVLRAEDASRLGIKPRELTYDLPVTTANGRALTAEALLPSLAVGSIVEHDLPILVAKAGAMHENLLGMTFLNRLASFTVADNKLVLRSR